jgi:hypothetical protein
LKRILKGAGVDGERGSCILGNVFWTSTTWPYNLCLVQELVYLQYWSLLVGSVWMYGCQQSRSALAFELHDDATDVGWIRYAQEHFSGYVVEIGVVLVRMLECYGDDHREWSCAFMYLLTLLS